MKGSLTRVRMHTYISTMTETHLLHTTVGNGIGDYLASSFPVHFIEIGSFAVAS